MIKTMHKLLNNIPLLLEKASFMTQNDTKIKIYFSCYRVHYNDSRAAKITNSQRRVKSWTSMEEWESEQEVHVSVV